MSEGVNGMARRSIRTREREGRCIAVALGPDRLEEGLALLPERERVFLRRAFGWKEPTAKRLQDAATSAGYVFDQGRLHIDRALRLMLVRLGESEVDPICRRCDEGVPMLRPGIVEAARVEQCEASPGKFHYWSDAAGKFDGG